MSVVVSKDENRTIIVSANEKYVINQSHEKGIVLSIGPRSPIERLSKEPSIELSTPAGTKTI